MPAKEQMYDTQIVSSMIDDPTRPLPRGSKIASITAKELLLAQSRNGKKPKYYLMNPSYFSHLERFTLSPRYVRDRFGNPKWARRGSRYTDSFTITFGEDYPQYTEYGDQAVADTLSENQLSVLKLCIKHLPKDTQKMLIRRFEALVEAKVGCLPTSTQVIERGLDLFWEFAEKYECKANFNNTINDILILATALEHKLVLNTKDVLLGRFAANKYGTPFEETNGEMTLDFTEEEMHAPRSSKESKGYVNRGWFYSQRKANAVDGR
jgi:hypothetical protein